MVTPRRYPTAIHRQLSPWERKEEPKENWYQYLMRLLGDVGLQAPSARVTAPEPPPISGEEIISSLLKEVGKKPKWGAIEEEYGRPLMEIARAEKARREEPEPRPLVTERGRIPVPPEKREFFETRGVPIREVTPGEEEIRAWTPWIVASFVPGLSATAGWQALTKFGAKGVLPKVAEVAGKAVLSPLYGLEKGAGKLLGLPIKGIEKVAKKKLVKEAEKVAKSTAEIWDEMAVGARTALAKEVGLKGTRGQATWAKLSGQEQEKLVGALTEVPAKPPVPLAEAVPEVAPKVAPENIAEALALKATTADLKVAKQATKDLAQSYKNLQALMKPPEYLAREAKILPEGKLPQATIDNYALKFLLSVDDAARSGVKLTDEQLAGLPPEIVEQVTAQMAKSLAATPTRPTAGGATAKLVELIKVGRKIRAEEYEPAKAEALRVATARAAAKAEKAPPTIAGQKAIEAQLAREVKPPAFAPPMEQMTAEELAVIHQHIWQAPEMFYERLHASEAFWALAQGQIPQANRLAALEQFLGTAITKEAKKKIMSAPRKAIQAFTNVIGLPRAVQASYDLSAPFRQGFWIGFIAPKEWAAAWSPMLKAFVKEENALYLREVMKASPWIRTGVNSNLELTSLGLRRAGTFLAEREEPFMTEFAHLIPGVRMSERAYTTYLDWLRLNSFARFAQAQGFSPTSKITPALQDTAKLVNWLSGRGPKLGDRDVAVLLNNFFFSVRFQTSRAMMLANMPGLGFSFRRTPYIRKLYAQAMARGIGATSTALAMLHYSGLGKVEIDPRSTRFGKVQIGNVVLDPWGGMQPYVRVVANLATNQRKAATSGRLQDIGSGWWEGAKKTAWDYVKTKTSPVAGFALDWAEGETYMGEEMAFESDMLLEQAFNRLAPFAIQDVMEAVTIEDWSGLPVAAPALVGFGIYTIPDDPYELQVPNLPEETTTPWQAILKDTGQELTYKDLNVLQRGWVKETARAQPDFEEPRLRLEGKFYASWREARDEMKEEYHKEALPYATSKAQGKITSEEFFDETSYIRDKFWGTQAVQVLFEKMLAKIDPALSKNFERWREEDIKPEDAEFDAYMDVYSNVPKDKDGVSDWEKWSKNRKTFLNQKPEWIRDYIETRLTQRFQEMPDPLGKLSSLYYDARQGLDGYYAEEQGRSRAYYLYNNPIINAKVFILGRVKTIHTQEAGAIIERVLKNNGFNSEAWIKIELEK